MIDFDDNVRHAYKPPMVNAGYPTDTVRGDLEQGLRAADVTHEAVYDTPIEHHNPIEPHATIAAWEGDKLTLYDSTQIVGLPVLAIAATFRIPKENIRVLAPFIGGGFGSKIVLRGHVVLAVMAAKMTNRPVKIALTRQQRFTNASLRQHNRQKVRLGATRDGKLTALAHEIVTHTSVDEEFVEQTGVMARMMYEVPNNLVTHRVFPLNVQVPTFTRAPGETPGSFVGDGRAGPQTQNRPHRAAPQERTGEESRKRQAVVEPRARRMPARRRGEVRLGPAQVRAALAQTGRLAHRLRRGGRLARRAVPRGVGAAETHART